MFSMSGEQDHHIDEPVDEPVDGRRLRRERGRRAVVDATIDLVLEGSPTLSADQVATRAGVSQASLFRYFDSLDELRRAAIARYFERFDALLSIERIGDGSFDERVDAFVASRRELYDRTAPMARFVRRQAPEVDEIARTLERLRSTLADQLAQHFAPELARFDDDTGRRRVAVLAALTSFEVWDQLAPLGDPGRDEAWRDALTSLLSPTP